ncbi:MAG: hypothetical protein WAK26_14605 [Terracidiphilus sp.]
MTLVQRLCAIAFIAAATINCALMSAQAGDPTAIQRKLYKQFKLTTTTADRSDIVTPGDVVVIHAPGLVMYAAASPMPPSNTYKHGRISQGWSGFGKDLAITMASGDGGTAMDYPHRTFVPDEKCWVTGITVEGNDVLFQLYSDPFDGIRYYANLKIPFPRKNTVPSAEELAPLVVEVLTVVPQDNQADQGGQQGQPAPPPPESAPAAPMPMIAPPPPPADAPPPTIALGQTKSQVTAAFGQPLRLAKLGVKEIYYYKDMKVTFTNGKVTNVELRDNVAHSVCTTGERFVSEAQPEIEREKRIQ